MRHRNETTPFARLMKRARWRVCDVRDIAGVDYTTAADWKRGIREMRLAHAAKLAKAAQSSGVAATFDDFLLRAA